MKMQTVVRVRARVLVAASIGNAIEYYDFLSYIFFAATIATVFFPGRDPTTKLLLTFGTFGVSFLARPVGALVLGAYADRKGRPACMILSIWLMTLGSLIMTVMPGYRSIGLLGPLGILVARLIQGFSLGGEFGSSTAFMIEQSKGGEARASSWQGTSQAIGGTTALGIAWILSILMPAHVFQQWSFRVAFGIGVLAGPVAVLLRRQMRDAPVLDMADGGIARPPAEAATLLNICLSIGLIALSMGEIYLGVYLPTYATVYLHMSSRNAFGAIFVLYLIALLLTPVRLAVAGWFDRSRRVNLVLMSCVLMSVGGYPAFILLTTYPNPVLLLLVPVTLNLLGTFYLSPLQALMGMIFTRRRRGIGLSVSYALGVAVFGGFTPFILTWLIAKTGDLRSPGLYTAATGVITILAMLLAKRRLERPTFDAVRSTAQDPQGIVEPRLV